MRIDPRLWAAPLAAAIIMVLVLTQTREALRLSGAWMKASDAAARAPSPFAALDAQLSDSPRPAGAIPRDPLRAGPLPSSVTSRPTRPAPASRPGPPPRPVLTSIVFDADPRATLRWNGRDYSVRSGALFADFRVVSISREQVTLDRGGETLILRMPQRGDNP